MFKRQLKAGFNTTVQVIYIWHEDVESCKVPLLIRESGPQFALTEAGAGVDFRRCTTPS